MTVVTVFLTNSLIIAFAVALTHEVENRFSLAVTLIYEGIRIIHLY